MKSVKDTMDAQYAPYLLNTALNKRIEDVYLGVSTHRRPPYIHDMFENLIQMEAFKTLENSTILTEEERLELEYQLWKQEDMTAYNLLESPEKIMDSVLHYTRFNHMTALGKTIGNRDTLLISPYNLLW